MKRALGFLLALLVAPSVFAAARTASVDGLWNATATWGGSSVPALTDACTISAGVEVVCDITPCLCGSLAVNGLLTMKSGTRTLKLGNVTGSAGDGNLTIASGAGVYGYAGQTLEFNIDRSGGTDAGIVANSGTFVWAGKQLFTTGKIGAVGAISGSAPTRKIVLTDSNIAQPVVDYYSGKYLVPTSGYFRNHFFTITTGGTTINDIAILTDDRGALDTRDVTGRTTTATAWAPGDWGETVYRSDASADDVVISGSTLTFDAGIFAFSPGHTEAINALLGSRFICASDLDTANDADVRRICSVTDETHATLCTAYGGAGCGGGGAGFYVWDDNQPPKAVILQEQFRPGDTYEIIDPAFMTVTAARRSDTAPSNHWNLTAVSGSTTRLTDILIDYCGQDLDGGDANYQPSCLDVTSIDNSLDTEQFTLTRADIWHYSGENAVDLHNCRNMTLERINIHDATEGGEYDSHEAHGFYVEDASGNERVYGINIRNNRIKGSNDGGIVFSGNETDAITCDTCTVTNNWIGMIPANRGGSVEGIVVLQGMKNSRIGDNFVTNIEDFGIVDQPTDITPNYVTALSIDHNLVLNSCAIAIEGGLFSGALGVPDAYNKIAVTNNAVIGFGDIGVYRGYSWSNFVASLNTFTAQTQGAFIDPQGMTGNVCVVGPNLASNVSGCAYLNPSTTATMALFPSNVMLRDNVGMANQTQLGSGVSGYIFNIDAWTGTTNAFNATLDHNSIVCLRQGTDQPIAMEMRAPPSQTMTVTNSIAVDCYYALHAGAEGAGGDTVASYNLLIKNAANYAAVTDGGNNVLTGTIPFASMYDGNLAVGEGSTPWSSLGSDSYPRGVRVAGPPRPWSFAQLYPFPLVVDDWGLAIHSASDSHVLEIVNSNTIGDVDTDGDGVWDLHDNCDRVWNANQYDGDGDGIGCACDTSGDTCP